MSVRSDFQGDYMGFSFGAKHSSELGIVRVSNGSRFDENLLPTMQDKTVQVPGGDGTYYFGSYYTQRQFSISFAFDDLTESEVAQIRKHFGGKDIRDLIFDERPYKVYRAKVTGNATLKYLAFDEGSTHRLYKGEGTIQFTCYDPFARCYSTNPVDYGMVRADVDADNYKKNTYYYHNTTQKKFILDSSQNFNSSREYYTSQNVQKVNEWWAASRISEGGNFGDVPVSFTKEISSTDTVKTISFGTGESVSWTNLPEGVTAILDTKLGLAKAADGTIYNQYITGDTTLKIPAGATADKTAGLTFTCRYI